MNKITAIISDTRFGNLTVFQNVVLKWNALIVYYTKCCSNRKSIYKKQSEVVLINDFY